VLGAPLQAGDEPRPAKQVAGVVAAGLPLVRGDREVPVQPPPFGVFVEPRPKARPFAQERLVRDLRRALANGDETVVGEHVEHSAHVGVTIGVEVRERDTAADGAAARVLSGEPQHDRSSQDLLRTVQPLVGRFGEARDGTGDAARALVGDDAQVAPVPALPQLEQGGRQ
jgi:hypothetical protein